MQKVVITSFARTAVGAYCGALKTVPVEDLAALVVKEALKRSGIENTDVDGIVLGHVVASPDAPNLARSAALLNGLEKTPGLTLNRICGSGIQAIVSAAQQLQTGGGEIMVAGGAEALSRIPYYLPLSVRYEGFYRGNKGLKCADANTHANSQPQSIYSDIQHMGDTTENIVAKYNISREEQDLFAYNSQMRAKAAMESGRFATEIVPVEIKNRKGSILVDTDEHPRPDTTLESLAQMKPVFKKGGSVTVGNSSGANDGAAALVLMTEEKCQEMGLKPLAYVLDYGISALDPRYMGLGPVSAIQQVLKKTGLKLAEIDLLEINEAFAGQVLGCLKELDFYFDSPLYQRLNVNGGGVSLGHPLGCSGARITGTLAYELELRQGRYGISSACIGGGQGIALLLERA